MKLFQRNAKSSTPEARLRSGVPTLAKILAPNGFIYVLGGSGNSSGGLFVSGEFVRANRRLEFHVRHGLGLVRYHFGSHSASHEYYMKELGVWPQCQYPGFPSDPLDPFVRLAMISASRANSSVATLAYYSEPLLLRKQLSVKRMDWSCSDT